MNSSVTPEEFWKAATLTATPITAEQNGVSYPVGQVVNPEKMIEQLGKQS